MVGWGWGKMRVVACLFVCFSVWLSGYAIWWVKNGKVIAMWNVCIVDAILTYLLHGVIVGCLCSCGWVGGELESAFSQASWIGVNSRMNGW